MKCIFCLLLVLAGISPILAAPAQVLCISDVPETAEPRYYETNLAYLWQLEYWFSPARMLGPDFAVTQVGWLAADQALRELDQYQALLIWDAPSRIEDKRNSDRWFANLEIISPDAARKIVSWVKAGGALIVAGGVTCYGDSPAGYGATTGEHSTGQADLRHFIGYHDSPLAEVLPVTLPAGATLANGASLPRKKPVDPLFANLDLSWKFTAYHNVAARPQAQVLWEMENADPLLVRWPMEKGKVACVLAAPRGNLSFSKSGPSPLWRDEPVFWDRLLRWSLGQEFSPGAEKAARARFDAAVAPPAQTPLALTQREYPYGVHVCDSMMPMSVRDLSMKFYRESGFNHIVMQHTRLEGDNFEPYLKEYAEGLERASLDAYLHPDLCAAAGQGGLPPEKWSQVAQPSGKLVGNAPHYNPDPFCPAVTEAAVKQVEHFMPIVKKYPRIRGCFYDDEWDWVMGYRNPYEEGPGIGSYSAWANDRYKKLAGKEAPLPVWREPGYVAPENDEWLKWTQIIRQDAFAGYNQALAGAFKKHRPDFRLCNYPGGFEGNLDIMMEEVYLESWFQSPLETLERMDVRANFREDRLRNKYPTWALIGLMRGGAKSMDAETLRLTCGLCLGGAAKGIILWNTVNLWAPFMQIDGHEPLYREAARFGDYLRKFGGMFPLLEKAPADAWMLSGWFWVNSFDNYHFVPPPEPLPDKEFCWWGFQIGDVAVPAALKAGLYTEFVTEKQLLSDELFRKKAVLLPGLLYCRQGVLDNLEKYIAQGGKVFLDGSARVKIKGATVLPVDFSRWHYDISENRRPKGPPYEKSYRESMAMREGYVAEVIPLLKKAIVEPLAPAVRFDAPEAVYTMLQKGATKYLCVFNADTSAAHTFAVTCRDLPGHIFDFEAGWQLATETEGNSRKFKLELPAGGWKILALADRKPARLDAAGTSFKDGTLNLKVRLLDDKDQAFAGVVPLRITLVGADKKEFALYQPADLGVLDLAVPCAGAVPRPAKLLIRELFTGREIVFSL